MTLGQMESFARTVSALFSFLLKTGKYPHLMERKLALHRRDEMLLFGKDVLQALTLPV